MTAPIPLHRPAPATLPVDRILALMAARHSCREFDDSAMEPEIVDAIVADGTQAPSSCNQQQWHFIVVSEKALKLRAWEISGGNVHFRHCSVLIYLCFQKGWTHDKFSVVQSVAGAAYHMMLSAHLRGYAVIWNAGIGDTRKVAEMLGVPANFELIGALAIGQPKPTAPAIKAPRRPVAEIHSWNRFIRPAATLYPVKPAPAYPFFAISNAYNPFAEWNPAVWGWDRIADFRGYAVWAKSPTAGVYVSRRQADATGLEIAALPDLAAGARLVDVMPWGGTGTTELRRRFGPDVHLHVAELSRHNHLFILERLRQEGLSDADVHEDLMVAGRLPYDDASIDAVFVGQTLEHMPEPWRVLDEVRRVLKPGGTLVVSARNKWSRYGWSWWRRESRAPVPNLGPFVPLSARALHRELAARFDLADAFGVSLQAAGDATRLDGFKRFLGRLFIARAVKR